MRATAILLAIATVAAPLIGNAADKTSYCTARELRASDTVTIALKPGVRAQPAFYLRSTQYMLVLFFKPDDVVALLQDWIAKEKADKPASWRSDLEDPLEWIRRDLPLKEDTDLFKYVLRDEGFGTRLDYLAAGLLDDGNGAVDFWPVHVAGSESSRLNDGFDPTTIKRVYWSTRGGDGHMYCKTDGFGILSIVETIND
jgi:hypothetical protein